MPARSKELPLAPTTTVPPVAYRFLIVLAGTTPLVWRRILVPATYTFWDLHVAIQDAMGWKDHHLHEFEIPGRPGERPVRIGLPNDAFHETQQPLPGWKLPIAGDALPMNAVMHYTYDFGDDWLHAVVHEGFEQIRPGRKLPACIGGAGTCPPEDCGGAHGYEEFLKTIANPRLRKHRELLEWAGGSFDPHAFDPKKVKFDDPRERWKIAFEEEDA